MSDYKNSAIRNANLIDEQGLKTFWDGVKSYIDKNLVDTPIIKGDAENSGKQIGEYKYLTKTYQNKAVSPQSIALGGGANAGLKGYYYSKVSIANKQIALSTSQPTVITNSSSVLSSDGSLTCGYSVGDIVSIQFGDTFPFCNTIASIDGNVLTMEEDLPITSDKFVFNISTVTSGVLGITNPFEFIVCSVMATLDDNDAELIVRNWNVGLVDVPGSAALAEGINTYAIAMGAHAEGIQTIAVGMFSHAEGYNSKAEGQHSHAEGHRTWSIGEDSHVEGYKTRAEGRAAHAEGKDTRADGLYSHAEGVKSVAYGYASHAEGGYGGDEDGKFTHAVGSFSHAEGWVTEATGYASHSEGKETHALGEQSHAEGLKTTASGPSAHAEGEANVAGGDCSHVEGYLNETTKTGVHIEGKNNSSEDIYAHIEGVNNTANGAYSHIEGVGLSAIVTLKSAATESTLYEIQEDKPTWLVNNDRVWVQGFGELTIKEVYSSNWIKLSKKLGIGDKETIKSVIYSVSQGSRLVRTESIASHAEGIGTITNNAGESAVGRFNESVKSRDFETLFSVGNGTSDDNRRNALEVKSSGEVFIQGVDNSLQFKMTEQDDLKNRVSALEENGVGSSATPDWNANENDEGYIKNKPFYGTKSSSEDAIVLFDVTDQENEEWFEEAVQVENFELWYNDINIDINKKYTLKFISINDEITTFDGLKFSNWTYNDYVEYEYCIDIYADSNDKHSIFIYYNADSNELQFALSSTLPENIKYCKYITFYEQTDFKAIDEMYIPDTIARVSQVENIKNTLSVYEIPSDINVLNSNITTKISEEDFNKIYNAIENNKFIRIPLDGVNCDGGYSLALSTIAHLTEIRYNGVVYPDVKTFSFVFIAGISMKQVTCNEKELNLIVTNVF